MTKNKNTTTETIEEASAPREVSKRKKVYERPNVADIPEQLVAEFKKDNYDLKLIRWSLEGQEDLSYLSLREGEGYEFVKPEELPSWYLKSVRIMDTRYTKGLITFGDLCLMKIDSDLRKSRMAHYQKSTDRQVDAVDINVLEKKGFKNLGTRSRIMHKEPSFQD